jgi:DNA-directed RNA polymerase subunit RPC12/RpoP
LAGFDKIKLSQLMEKDRLTMPKIHIQNKEWSPPDGFIKVDSKVPGVIVYAPKPKVNQVDDLKQYACPNCGANVAYNVSAGGIACEYCGYIAPVVGKRVGRAADEFEFTLETISQSTRGWGTKRQVLHCDSCGAELSIAHGEVTTTCPFCASNQVNVTTSPDQSLRPRFLIPFKVTLQDTRRLAQDWLGKGWFHPKELASGSLVRKFTGIYLPYWTFDTRVNAAWQAEVGYEKKVRHYNASAKRWETRTTIVWRWEDGSIRLNIDDFLVSGSDNQHINQPILNQLLPFELNGLIAYQPDYLAGWQAQAYETTLTEAWETAKTAIREQAKKACYQDIPTNHVRNFSMTADFADESWRYILLPIYIATYKYEDKRFQMMVNGQTGKVAGQKPVAWWKIWLAIAAALAPGLIAGGIGLLLIMFDRPGALPAGLGIMLFIIGMVISFVLLKKARQSEVGS